MKLHMPLFFTMFQSSSLPLPFAFVIVTSYKISLSRKLNENWKIYQPNIKGLSFVFFQLSLKVYLNNVSGQLLISNMLRHYSPETPDSIYIFFFFFSFHKKSPNPPASKYLHVVPSKFAVHNNFFFLLFLRSKLFPLTIQFLQDFTYLLNFATI